jgi:hypothetical protein
MIASVTFAVGFSYGFSPREIETAAIRGSDRQAPLIERLDFSRRCVRVSAVTMTRLIIALCRVSAVDSSHLLSFA